MVTVGETEFVSPEKVGGMFILLVESPWRPPHLAARRKGSKP